jgi:hypothetical protein
METALGHLDVAYTPTIWVVLAEEGHDTRT